MKWIVSFAVAALVGCGGDSGPPASREVEASAAPAAGAASEWMGSPRDGIQIRDRDDALLVITGPHAVLWQREAAPLEPPYTVRAQLRKLTGRIHEGYGLIFGGDPLDVPEEQQAYSYFLIRGDGSFLIRRREGAELPILRGWTTDRAILRDVDQRGQPNQLEVEVGSETTVFRVNGNEVAQLPTAELRTRGAAGLRVAHDVELEVRGFRVERRADGSP